MSILEKNDKLYLMSSIFGLILLSLGYDYLYNLKNCDCVNKESVDSLKNIQSILITVFIIQLPFFFIKKYFNIKTMKSLFVFFAAYSIFMFSIYYLFLYHFYKFITTVKADCSCYQNWKRYQLYFQAGSYSLIFISIIFLALTYLFKPMKI
jgi:hypothetical protein